MRLMVISEELAGFSFPDGSPAPAQTATHVISLDAIATISLVPQVDPNRTISGHLVVLKLLSGVEYRLGNNLRPDEAANHKQLLDLLTSIEKDLQDPAINRIEVKVLTLG